MNRTVQQAIGYVRLVRPLNVAMMLVGVGLGGVLVAGWAALESVPLLMAALSAAAIGAAGNSYNDVADVAIDQINRPNRPLPSGLISSRGGVGLWLVLTVLGVGLGFVLSVQHGLLALASAALLVAYSRWLKRQPLAGNVAVAVLIALALVYGGLAVGSAGAVLVGALFAFLTTLAREIAKDVEDEPGDAAAGARTLPLVWGRGRATTLAQVVVAVTLVLLPVPYFAFDAQPLYLLTVLGAAAALTATLVRLHAATPQRAGHASRTLKWAMLAGMAALAVG